MGGSSLKYGIITCTGYTGATHKGIDVFNILGDICFEVIQPNKIRALNLPSTYPYTLTKIATGL